MFHALNTLRRRVVEPTRALSTFSNYTIQHLKRIPVSAYGAQTGLSGNESYPLSQLASISIDKRGGIEVKPFDSATLSEIAGSLTEQHVLGLKVKVLGEKLVLAHSNDGSGSGSSRSHTQSKGMGTKRQLLTGPSSKYRLASARNALSASEFGGTVIRGPERVASRRAMRRVSLEEELETFGRSWY